ncbi:MAG TPA: TonB-dependent receptor, partial [Steroidobacteraceae bacterium]|nr:TonB-dependent receptor [Steroidobacteraceae bacterium]
APAVDSTISALELYGFFNEFPIPPSAYNFDLVFSFPPINGHPIEGVKVGRTDSWNDLSPRFVLDYKVAPNVMVFGSVAKGYKAGGFNSVEPLSRFDPEHVWNFEGGVKSLFADIGVIVNASVFYFEYSNKQEITLVQGTDGVAHYVVDSSDQKAHGVDLDARWQPLNALTLSLSAEYIDSTYKKYVAPDGTNLTGQPTGEPHWSVAAGASYVWTLPSSGKIDLSGQFAYRGETRCNADSVAQGNCLVTPHFTLGSATERLDARLGWSSSKDRWGVAAYVTNLLNKQYVTGISNLTALDLGTPVASVSAPRMWGLEARVGL